jgi:Na+-driven multidrug efflux pump
VTGVNIIASCVVIHKLQLGIIGGVFATGGSYWLAALLAMFYIYFIDGHQAWVRPSAVVFQDLWPLIRVVLLGLLMVGSEW